MKKSNTYEPGQSSIAYICGKCHKEVEKEAKICKYCGAHLGKIRCPYCNFTGEIEDFKHDTCPKCGKKSKIIYDLNKVKSPVIKNIKIQTSISKKLFLLLFILLIFILFSLFLIFIIYFKLI